MINAMCDLETMSDTPNAAIVAIGVVKFDEEKILDKFYQQVTLRSSMDLGLQVSAETIMFWMKQVDEARKELYTAERNLSDVLSDLSEWLSPSDNIKKSIRVWGNGSDFDNVILANAYRAANIDLPWNYYNNRCYRTIKNGLGKGVTKPKPYLAHHALSDAIAQTDHLLSIVAKYRDLRGLNLMY